MAPRWLSRQSAWGASVSSGPSNLVYAGVAGGIFLLGIGFGFLFDRGGAPGPGGSEIPAVTSPVILANVNGMAQAAQTPDGAAKAATSFLTGFPEVALATTDSRRRTIASITAPGTDPAVQRRLDELLAQLRQEVAGPVGQEVTAKIIHLPATYRTTMAAPDRASVQIWYSRVFLDARTNRFEQDWATAEISMIWSDGRWLLGDYTGQLGPTPQAYATGGVASPYLAIAELLAPKQNPPSQAFSYRYAVNE